jgi:hypothetical protein
MDAIKLRKYEISNNKKNRVKAYASIDNNVTSSA